MVMMKTGIKKILKSTPPYFLWLFKPPCGLSSLCSDIVSPVARLPLFSAGQPVRVICSFTSAIESMLVPWVLFNVRGCHHV